MWISGKTRTKAWRKAQLESLLCLMEEQEGAMCDALYKDLHKVFTNHKPTI